MEMPHSRINEADAVKEFGPFCPARWVCETCIDALFGSDSDAIHSLIKLKSKGHLIHPSDDVIEICVCCEKMFRESIGLSKCNNEDLSLGRKKFQKIVISVIECFIRKNIFAKLYEHMYDTEQSHNHLVLLMKAVAEKYLQVRYIYAAKHFSAKLLAQNKMKSRQTYTKLIHFSGQ